MQLYQDQTWLKGKHELRFGGSYVHINDDHTFSAYSNAVEALNTTNNALVSLDNLVLGQILRFQKAINPTGYPGGTFVTPVEFPSFTSFNRYNEFALYAADNWSVGRRLTLNLGMRYEYFGPQLKSEPKYDSNFYYGDPNLDTTAATPQQILAAVRSGQAMPSNEGPTGTLWKSDWNNFAPRVGFAWDVNGDGRTSLRGGYGIAYDRNFGNVTYNVLFNPPEYLVATVDVPLDLPSQPIYTDNGGPFAGVPGVVKPIPRGQSAPRRSEHQDRLCSLVRRVVPEGAVLGGDRLDRVQRVERAQTLRSGGHQQSRRAARLRGHRHGEHPRQPAVLGVQHARQPRQLAVPRRRVFTRCAANRGNRSGPHDEVLLSNSKDNLSGTFSDADNNGFFNLGYLDAFDPMLDYGYSGFDVRHRFSLGAIWNLPFGGTSTWAGGWQMNAILTARSGYPFSVFDSSNGLFFNMRAIDDADISKSATSGPATGNPNEFELLDLTPILGSVGSYVNPLTGNSDFGPYPSNMTERNAFRGPGAWNVDFIIGKRFRFGTKAVLARLEAYNLFNHHNMYVRSENADISSFSSITGYLKDNRRMQFGFKFEF